jgi:hypothetical protein
VIVLVVEPWFGNTEKAKEPLPVPAPLEIDKINEEDGETNQEQSLGLAVIDTCCGSEVVKVKVPGETLNVQGTPIWSMPTVVGKQGD